MIYSPVIGLEVHAQLLTKTKLFCPCSTKFGGEPNTQTCPVCLGMPGVLPVVNKKAVEFAVKTALATDCNINQRSIFARKNYFYPDLPKGYQISQYEEPLAQKGFLEIEIEGEKKRIGITRLHMEEDAGKLLHGETLEDYSFVDLNRAGVPLIEIVSEPDIRTPDEAVLYLKALRDILVYLEVCDGNMQEGSLRCDANVSIRPPGSEKFGVKVEIKNMNSFKFLKDALAYEIDRQSEVLRDGGRIVQETRLFDPSTGQTRSMRSKEEAHDYRYFPEPDLLALIAEEKAVADVKKTMPELPMAKKQRFIRDYSIPAFDSSVLVASRELADFYEDTVKKFNEPKTVSNWVMGELLRLLNERSVEIKDCRIAPEALAGLLTLVKGGNISGKMAKEVFEEMFETGKPASAIVGEKGLAQISDEGALIKLVEDVIKNNPKEVERYKAGNAKLMGFFVGGVMKATKGQANPSIVGRLLKERLG